MKIKFIVQKNSGISYHRFINPMSYMQWEQGDSAELLWISEEQNLNCDILMYNKFCATSINDLKKLQEKGMKIVVDVDDLWTLPTTHPNYKAWEKNRHSERVAENIRIADMVICTSILLQDRVRELNKNTVVIPNAFPYGQENYRPIPILHDKTVFMYMGGSTHYPDVKLLEGKFKRINSDPYIKNNAEFVLAGYETGKAKRFMTQMDKNADNDQYKMIDVPGEYGKMAAVFSQTSIHRILPSTNLDEYINYYDQADIALVPLVQNEWNSMKSVLKICEAGAKGIPVICSKVQPYWPELQNCPGIMWVEEGNDWLVHIKYCIKNPQKIRNMGWILGEYCKEHYNLIEWNKLRYQVLKSLA